MKKFINAFIDFFYFDFFAFIPKDTFRYLACGGFTVVTDLVVYFLSYNYVFLKEPVPVGNIVIGAHIAAFIVSFLVSFPLGFFLNKYIVFTHSELKGRIQLFRYGLAVLSCIGLNYLFLKLFVEICGWYATPSKALTTLIVTVYSYFTQQYFTFKVKSIR
ncbi:MAG: GtrA family protein [Chitinophagaceae bacterium]|nr:GtrA family protein [Chitinophagaceae bacterium]